MSLVAAAGSEIVLTDQQVRDWPRAERDLPMAVPWPPGHAALFSTPAVERAVPVHRRLALRWLDAAQVGDEEARHTVLLILSELVTNALQHSDSSCITSVLQTSDDLVHVEVRDQGGTPSVPQVTCGDVTNDHSRGLLLVAESARRWGWALTADGSCSVWAAVPAGPPPSRSASRTAPDITSCDTDYNGP